MPIFQNFILKFISEDMSHYEFLYPKENEILERKIYFDLFTEFLIHKLKKQQKGEERREGHTLLFQDLNLT